MTYYNEFDPKAAAWLRELIRAGEIPTGEVDERSITEISPHELTGYTQQHFFAGIGGWAYALRLAGWPDDRPVRTGSCPCQPFSGAGLGLGEKDDRHLWPVFRDLITFGEATVTFGEQVASAAGRVWLSRVRADLEGLGYGVGAADLCSAGVGSPNIRQRLFWVADAKNVRRTRNAPDGCARKSEEQGRSTGRRPQRCGVAGGLGDTNGEGCEGRGLRVERNAGQWPPGASGLVGIECADGKARRINPAIFPLAPRVPGDVALIRGAGNAINPWIAAEFIQACDETLTCNS